MTSVPMLFSPMAARFLNAALLMPCPGLAAAPGPRALTLHTLITRPEARP